MVFCRYSDDSCGSTLEAWAKDRLRLQAGRRWVGKNPNAMLFFGFDLSIGVDVQNAVSDEPANIHFWQKTALKKKKNPIVKQ